MAEKIVMVGAQDTGNPVLDSLVNIVVAHGGGNTKQITELHATLLELATKEPGGLRRRSKDGILESTEA